MTEAIKRDALEPHHLHDIFICDENGHLYWKVSRGPCKIGDRADRSRGQGRMVVTYNYRNYAVHRIIFAMHYGRWPIMVDHINHNSEDNRIANLREANISQNARNCRGRNKSGFKGVSKCKNKWQAFIFLNGKNKNLGSFPTPELASAAYEKAAKEHYGEFACTKHMKDFQ